MINPSPINTIQLFSGSKQYKVPRFQRNFTWGVDNASEMLDDLNGCMSADSSNNELYLGPIIFFDNNNSTELEIVDGQQRLTCLQILLMACRDVAHDLGNIPLESDIQNKIAFIDPTSAEIKGPRLIASSSIQMIFDRLADNNNRDDFFPNIINGKSIKRQINKIKPIYDLYKKHIESDAQSLSNLLNVIYNKTYFIIIEIDNQEEAFQIFERTNARGEDLEVSDLLKNYLFSTLDYNNNEIDEKWQEVIDNSGGSLIRLIKYFYVTYKGPINKSILYKGLKKYAGEVSPQVVFDQLYEFSKYFYVVNSGSKDEISQYLSTLNRSGKNKINVSTEKIVNVVYHSLEGFRLFKIFQIYPLIFSAIRLFNRCEKTNNSLKNLTLLFSSLEKYHFINNAVCNRTGNEVEILYANYCKSFNLSRDFDKSVLELLKILKTKLAFRDEFVGKFSDITYSTNTIPLIVYIFDRINNNGLHGNRIPIYNSNPAVLRKINSIEHIYPQKPVNGFTDQNLLESIDYIGNLLVISYHENSKLGNRLPNEKIILLEGDEMRSKIQNLNFIQDFINKYKSQINNWTSLVIQNRGKDLAIEAYEKVWNFSVDG